ncbi:hypothetical protein [Bernardetia sp.]|uniref:hypothetical protein n=1 Tax=Bernardetia sp. TaxID=1937974 RepID=UPI0025C265C7|nr:hypothetical protein [Bernardetia sp.]
MKSINLFVVSLIIIGLFSCQEKKAENEIRWKFGNFEKLTYEYHQISENKSSMMNFGKQDGKMLSKATGLLIVSPKEGGKADVVFKNVEMSLLSVSEEGDTTQTMKQSSPDFFMQDMDELGKIAGNLNQQTELLAQTLFPIPSEKLKVGQTSKIPISMPFNMLGSIINVTGFNEVKLESLEDAKAKVSTIIDVSEFEIPEDANVNYECYLKGSSNYTFDTTQGYFDTIDLNITMVLKNLASDNQDENDSLAGQEDLLKKLAEKFGMEVNTKISLRLKEVK